MRIFKIILYEFLLIFTSVLIFRSLWMMLDRVSWMNQDSGIIGSFIVGVIITVISLVKLNTILNKKKDTKKDD
jgi:hypothetical protein